MAAGLGIEAEQKSDKMDDDDLKLEVHDDCFWLLMLTRQWLKGMLYMIE